MATQPQSPPVDADWSRSQAIAWYARTIHNLAIQAYMANRTEQGYDALVEPLERARSELSELSQLAVPEDDDCPPPWCRDEWDRCVPCGANGGNGAYSIDRPREAGTGPSGPSGSEGPGLSG